jgi:hypothetical protein
MSRSLTLIVLFLHAFPCTAPADGWSEDWGDGRVFIEGHEIVPPLDLVGFGTLSLYASGVRIDPLPCEPYWHPPEAGGWICGNAEIPRDPFWPEDPWLQRLALQDRAVTALVLLSRLPLVMIGCDYLYRPGPEEAALVLAAIDAGAADLVVEAGLLPEEAARDLRVAREASR